MENQNMAEETAAETVIRYLDYRSQAEQRRKELDSLREQCLANTRGKWDNGSRGWKKGAVVSIIFLYMSFSFTIVQCRGTQGHCHIRSTSTRALCGRAHA